MPGPYIAILERSTGPFGWSSVYFPIATTLDNAADLADQINDKEMALLSEQVTAGLIRVSDMTIFNDSRLRSPTTTKGTYGTVPGPGPGVIDPNLAVPIKISAGDNHRTTKFLRGVPTTLVSNLGRATFTPDQEWGNFQVLYENLMETSFNIVSRSPGPPPVFTPIKITSVLHYFVNAPVYMSIRRAGRPFGLPRGRARAG